EVAGKTEGLIETTAGTGQALGSRFEEIAELRARIPEAVRGRVGVCMDSWHVYGAGYDLARRYEALMDAYYCVIDHFHLGHIHLHDSQKPIGSHRDRHTDIGEGTLGDEPFRRLMNDPRFAHLPKVLETPKGDDHTAADRRNLQRLRSYAR